MTTTSAATTRRQMLNKVPEVTVFFWVIKILCTTVGESLADYINETLGFGLTNTTRALHAWRWSWCSSSSSAPAPTSLASTGSPWC